MRQSYIDQSLPHAVAYMYALTKSGGVTVHDAFRSLSEHSHVYGLAADEFGYIVRDMDYFGMDVLSAIRNCSSTTSSTNLKAFLDGILFVISSGGDLNSYLRSKTDQFHLDATKQQKTFLELLGVLAEAYVAVFVVGPIFMIIILVVFGFMGSGSMPILYTLIYLLIPVGTLFYLVLLSTISNNSVDTHSTIVKNKLNSFPDVQINEKTDTDDALIGRLLHNEKVLRLKHFLVHPFKSVKNDPSYIFYITIPVGIIYLLYVIDTKSISLNLSLIGFKLHNMNIGGAMVLDDYVMFATLLIFVPFVIFYESKARRIRSMEGEFPEFLNRLASINEAGILLIDAINMVAQTKIGVLQSEVRRMQKGLSWGQDLSSVFMNFESRVKTTMNSRIITLLVKASESTSDIIGVLHIAAKDAELQQNLRKERSTEMAVYVFIVYISFAVFLFIIYVLTAYFIPSIPNTTDIAAGMPLNINFDPDEFFMLFFHASLIQGFCSGLVAGQMGSGTLAAGVKHSIIMMLTSYAIFTLLI
ncbi:type II secretion system F family protein [Methanococcoides sp. SA1]|nr:type II secretion system F family protein [Methanococcoides sp. SA1]